MATTAMEPMLHGNTQILRNPNLDPISDLQLRKFAPTIYAKGGIMGVEGVKDVSQTYGFVSSKDIVEAMRDSGFEPVEVRYSRRRNEEKMPWTKHMVKFRQAGIVKKQQVGDVVRQIIMLNSHDRSSGFHLYGGLFRLVCSNGLMVSESDLVEPIKIMHTKRLVEDVIDRSKELIECSDGVYRLREDMLKTLLTEKQAIAFATEGLTYRPRRMALPDPKELLVPRRIQDEKNDLWHVYNRVQENMLRGGLLTTTSEGRQVMTRGIGRIERDVEINSGLWSLAVRTIAKAQASAKKATAAKRVTSAG